MEKGLKIALWIMILLAFVSIAFMMGFYWGSIEGTINTMSYCMLQNLTIN